ncbi:MAG: hypothetical protein FXF47_09150 [Candidatus Mcinerneyibacterium aminivorans]|uniref:Uncharacterized protein n=1 Tax=Candidatus Mcinerneyibacterium aminivorans TaxID=2703815 RepID=A0A5D0MGS1_9BACT|nr:MAG: hypothetical protein FXF47_09150 [Candidatus Mcinerneyibacterium aminivorans]
MGTILWSTFAVFLTLSIFSFLIKDNPFYKFAEHLFAGISVGYLVVITFTQIFIPRVWKPLMNSIDTGNILRSAFLIIGVFIGLLYLSRASNKYSWLSRYPISIVVGFGSGFAIAPSLNARVLKQLHSTVVEDGQSLLNIQKIIAFFRDPSFSSLYNATYGPLLVIGVLVVLIYFFFSFKNDNPVIKYTRTPALLYMMVGFGAAFGYTFMARISLFVDRMNFILNRWWPLIQNKLM